MKRLPPLLLPLLLLLVALPTGCSQYDTDVVGEAFMPLNGIVAPFTHLVYVEYGAGDVRVWGPAAREVHVERSRGRVTLTCDRDSMAYFCYGRADGDTLHPADGQLHIRSAESFALYLGGLRLHSAEGPAIWCETSEPCYLVLPARSSNYLSDSHYAEALTDAEGYAVGAEACLLAGGELIMDGTGSLGVVSQARPRAVAGGDSVPSHALCALGGLRCAYGVKVRLQSDGGDALHIGAGDMVVADGTWQLVAGRHAVCCEAGDVSLTGGTLRGSALGSLVAAPEGRGLHLSAGVVAGAAAQPPALHPDPAQFVWHARVDTLALEADSSVTVYLHHGSRARWGTLTSAHTLAAPWIVLSDSVIAATDTVRFER